VTIPAGTLVPRDARDFGAYELIAKLATGGMAEIFLARAQSAGPKGKVVLKRILPHLAEDEHFVTMFRDEANLASRLIHANVCRVHGLGHVGATWFIVMEYLHGVALSRMMARLAKKNELIDFRIVAGIVVQACEGLHHAHELRDTNGHLLNLVHRDVSPPNIMLCADGLVRLLDFGIAKARGANSKTRTGTVKGKNAYMSPEQILGKTLDRRSDIFALGCVMYELIAVKRLFHRDSDFLTFKAITEEPIPDIKEKRPDIPPQLRSALTQALARDPAGRFATAKALSEAVKDAVAPLGGPATAVELKRWLQAKFADDLAQRDELLKAADDPNAIPTGPMPSTGSGAIALKSTQPMPTSRLETETEELDDIDGELEMTDPRARPPDRAIVQEQSIVVASGPGARATRRPSTQPPPMPAVSPTPPPPPPTGPGARSSQIGGGTPAMATDRLPQQGAMFPSPLPGATALPGPMTSPSGSFPGVDASTHDLISGYRMKSIKRVATAVGALVLVGGIVMFVAASGRDDDEEKQPVAAAPIDAAPPAPPDAYQPPDASDRDQIILLSKVGFLSLEADAKTTIYIDGQKVGLTPLTNHPLSPGVHQVKAIGPKNKIQRFEVTIYAAQPNTHPMIKWK
jgi:serine/threonine-protein kinase